MSPPPRSRSGTRRRMGSESPPGSAGPPPWSMGSRRPILKPAGPPFALVVRQLDQPGEPAGHGGLRHGRVGPRRELPQGERRVAETELGGTLQRRGQVLERPAVEQRARGLELRARRTALPDEICVIGVREPVRVGAQPCDEGAFLEREHGLRCPRDREERLDRVPALRVGSRVRVAVDHAHANAGGRRDAADERRACVQRRPHLEMRRARPAQRAPTQEGASQVGRPAAGAGDDASRRPVERQPLAAEHTSLGQDLDRVRRALDEKLRACAPVERVTAVRADLRVHPEAPQDGERPTRHGRLREVEVERERPPAEEMHGARRVEERGDLREPVAAALGDEGRELRARVRRERGGAHSRVPSSASSRRLSPCPEGP